MPELTKSEWLFEEFCSIHCIRYNSIPTRGKEGKRTPDYEIFMSDQKIIVEIKQIEPNPEETDEIKTFEEGNEKSLLISNEPGDRIRKKIKNASKKGQIRNRTKGIYPSILVLHNVMGEVGPNYANPYDMLVGMYGFESLILSVPDDYCAPISVVKKIHGSKRRMTPKISTSISAVSLIHEHNSKIKLRVYHNYYAEVRLEPSLLCKISDISQYQLPSNPNTGFREWEKIVF